MALTFPRESRSRCRLESPCKRLLAKGWRLRHPRLSASYYSARQQCFVSASLYTLALEFPYRKS